MSYQDKKPPFIQSIIILGAALALGLLFDQLFFMKMPGLSFPLFTLGIAFGIWGLAQYLGHRLSLAARWLMLPFLAISAMVAIRSSELLTLMNLATCLLLLLVIARAAFRRELRAMHIGEYISLPLLPLRFVGPAFRTIRQAVATQRIIRTKPLTSQIIKGILMTLPVLAIFLMLFASADLIVSRYLADLVQIKLDPELIARLILVTVVTLALTAGYSYIFEDTQREDASSRTPTKTWLRNVETAILLGSVNLLFLAFILIQITYLFGGQANISNLGLTYAEYARRGFFELVAVVAVAFALLWSVEKYVKRTDTSHTRQFKALSIVLICQVMLVIASAFKRLYLYEQAYGFTTLRLYSHAFTILLAVVFVILAYKILRSATDQAFAFPTFLAAIGFIVAMNAINPDAFIARQNLDRYQTTGKLDVTYLGQLSDDAIPTLVNARSSLRPADAAALDQELSRRHEVRPHPTDWQSWNYSRSQADTILRDKGL